MKLFNFNQIQLFSFSEIYFNGSFSSYQLFLNIQIIIVQNNVIYYNRHQEYRWLVTNKIVYIITDYNFHFESRTGKI